MAESDFQRNYLTYAVEVLRIHFQSQPEVYVSGNLFLYYEQGNAAAVVAPDVFVVLGAEQRDRPSYRVWEEGGKVPDFILEITSKSTVSEDQGTKKGLYAYLGVREYWQYDPTGDYLSPRLKGLRLAGENYWPMAGTELPDGMLSLFSEVLNLELRLLPTGELRFHNPATGVTLLTHSEEAQRAQRLAAKLRELNIDPDTL
ncbi:Uma2 family endonuclease [Leptolyngbya sp. FACHB-261]|nr:Uma2 family endonuclease [Leptolyngbya sp. FACHB-261]